MGTSAQTESLLEGLGASGGAGNDPRASETFEVIERELAKFGGVDQESVDWGAVRTTSASLLQECGKDLRLAVYWSMGGLHLEGPDALFEGISLLAGLAERFGAELHPKRARARTGVLAWFAERLELDLEGVAIELTKEERGEADAVLRRLSALSEPLGAGEAELRRAESIIASKFVHKLSESELRDAALARFEPEVAELCMGMVEHPEVQACTRAGLRLHRFALWSVVPALNDGVLDVELDRARAAELASLKADERWADLLQAAEATFSENPFWLDLTHYVAEAAARVLNADAVDAVVGQLRDLLSREPELARANDQNGTPLASEEALAWVESVAFDAKKGPVEAQQFLPEEVRTLLTEGRHKDALQAASSWTTHPDGRVRFSRSAVLADAFAQARSPEHAHVVFRGLHRELGSMTLKDWDPTVFASCLRGFLMTKHEVSGLGPEDEELMDELSVLDPAAMLLLLDPGSGASATAGRGSTR